MVEHLQECSGGWFDTRCICAELRECEQRVLDAALEAVVGTCAHTKYEGCLPCQHDDAITAIEALRNET